MSTASTSKSFESSKLFLENLSRKFFHFQTQTQSLCGWGGFVTRLCVNRSSWPFACLFVMRRDAIINRKIQGHYCRQSKTRYEEKKLVIIGQQQHKNLFMEHFYDSFWLLSNIMTPQIHCLYALLIFRNFFTFFMLVLCIFFLFRYLLYFLFRHRCHSL